MNYTEDTLIYCSFVASSIILNYVVRIYSKIITKYILDITESSGFININFFSFDAQHYSYRKSVLHNGFSIVNSRDKLGIHKNRTSNKRLHYFGQQPVEIICLTVSALSWNIVFE